MLLRSKLQHPTGAAFEVRQGTSGGLLKEFSYSVTVTSTAGNSTNTAVLGSATPADPVPNAMAAATQFVRESHIGLAPDNTHKIVVNSTLAFADGFVANLSTEDGVNDASWKYVIAHEVGHTIQHGLFGMLAFDYTLGNSGYTLCNCSHISGVYGAHCLQSKEEIGAAQQEGWGQFIALDLMNDDTQTDASFIYYKKFRCPGDVSSLPGCATKANQIKDPPMAFNGRHPHLWVDNFCSVNSADRGTELDWMNFYYAVHTTGGAGQFFYTQFRDTYRQASGGGTCTNKTPTWLELKASAETLYGFNGGRAVHFRTSGSGFGVDQ
jgi:hypothetical protein